MAVIYRHIRLDTNEVFYIGIGKKSKRSKSKSGRNRYWLNVVKKTPYEVQVLKNNLSYSEACELEQILISYYGRKDLGLGKLVNLTDGGDTSIGYKCLEDTRIKIGSANRGNVYSSEVNSKKGRTGSWRHTLGQKVWNKGIKMDEFFKNKIRKPKSNTDNHFKSRIVLNTENGIYYKNIKEASESINMKYGTLRSKLQGKVFNNTNLIYC